MTGFSKVRFQIDRLLFVLASWRTQTACEHPTEPHRPQLDDQLEISCTEHTCVTLRAYCEPEWVAGYWSLSQLFAG